MRHWANGGETGLEHLILLCAAHRRPCAHGVRRVEALHYRNRHTDKKNRCIVHLEVETRGVGMSVIQAFLRHTSVLSLLVLLAGCTAEPKQFIDFDIGSGPIDRVDRHVVIQLKIDEFLGGDVGFLRVTEIDEHSNVVDDDVVFQFDRAGDIPALNDELLILLKGKTDPHTIRRFRVSFTSSRPKYESARNDLAVDNIGQHEGDESILIKAGNATYIYQMYGSGFSSIFDSDGDDWISYRHTSEEEEGSRGRYRGIPNLWNAGFHPGQTDGKSRTQIISVGPIRVRLYSQTADREWRCVWDIYSTHASMTLLTRGKEPYWFLYEGTPGGQFDLDDYWTLSNGERMSVKPYDQDNIWQDSLPLPKWVYFGDRAKEQVFFLIHHTGGKEQDQFWHFGEGTMTVFGFGRGEYGTEHWQQLRRTPGRFSIGFARDTGDRSVNDVIKDILIAPDVKR